VSSSRRLLAATVAVAVLGCVAGALVAVRPAASVPGRAARASAWPALRTAGPFLIASIEGKTRGRWGAAWDSLYPFHQSVVSRTAFVRCESTTPFSAPLRSMHVVRVRRADVRVPGLAHAVPGVAVTVHVELAWFKPTDPLVATYTFHLVPVDGRWTWLLSKARYRLYMRGPCGAGPAE